MRELYTYELELEVLLESAPLNIQLDLVTSFRPPPPASPIDVCNQTKFIRENYSRASEWQLSAWER